MTSKEIYEYVANNNVKELYKKFITAFGWIDEWSDKLINSDLLNEYELSFMLDKSTGIYSKLSPVVSALESYVERVINNEEAHYYNSQEKVKSVDPSVAKANARAKASDLRDYLADFKGYFIASQQMICSAQSRLKRLTIEKGAKGIDFTGDTSNVPQETEDERNWDE